MYLCGMNNGRLRYGLIWIIWGVISCSPPPAHPVSTGMYYWKTRFILQEEEQKYLKDCKVQRLFVKFADIAVHPMSGTVEPLSLLNIQDTTGIGQMEVTPCFFITNEVFLQLTEAQTIWLSDRIMETLESVGAGFNRTPEQWEEIQFDCDWTSSTRSSYFAFLKQMRRKLPDVALSATIRLHQYKNPRLTGVPPVQRGTLMCYNTGDIDAPLPHNSILGVEEAEKYLTPPAHYPLPLDLALPIFSWAPVYRDDHLWRIIPDPAPMTWSDSSRFDQSENQITVKAATFVGGHYLSPGDLVRIEAVTPELLFQMVPLLRQTDLAPDAGILFYHLDTNTLRNFSPVQIQRLCDTLAQHEN